MVLMCVWQRSHLKNETLCAGVLAALRSINTKGTMVSQTPKPTSKTRAACQRHTEQGHRQITSILDTCFHTDMDELKHAHPPRETEPDGIIAWLLVKAHSGARRAARLWQEYFRNEVFMSAGWNVEAVEPNPRNKTEDLNNDDDVSLYGHRDSFKVELMIDVLQDRECDEGAQSEHQSANNHWNCGQDRETNHSGRPAGITGSEWSRERQH